MDGQTAYNLLVIFLGVVAGVAFIFGLRVGNQ
jgi:hypothetical protein